MRHSLWLCLLAAVLTGYRYEFPRDYFNHPDFETEWWYYTGNLQDAQGHAYGFELTFFRQAVPLGKNAVNSTWRPDQLYLAHLALTDINGHEFYHTERLNRSGPGLAGISLDSRKYWNGNWQVYWKNLATGEQQLQAVCDRFTLTLSLDPLKPAVIHGKNGLSVKGPREDEASHYISFTRLAAQGQLTRGGSAYALNGLAWMDHEFFTEQPDPNIVGWDWFAIQLDGNKELMLSDLRTKSGVISPFSAGTYVDPGGKSHFLIFTDFSVIPGRRWRQYPVDWQISVPALRLKLTEQTRLDDQELSTPGSLSPAYWEGAVKYSGVMQDKDIRGVGYLEMTGYAPSIGNAHLP